MKVKICGVRTPEAAAAVEAAGAAYAGLNFVTWSRRCLDPDRAKIVRASLDQTTAVGVFFDQPIDEIERLCGQLSLEWIQLHGSETPEVVSTLSTTFSVIKAFAIDERFTPDVLADYAEFVELFLFDAPRAGSGRTFDWTRVPKSPRPFLLAGGLTPENVKDAIDTVRPFGVDTASGVEVDGAQSPERIRAFVEAASP